MKSRTLKSSLFVSAVLVSLAVIADVAHSQGVGSSRGLPGSTLGGHVIQGKVYDNTGRPVSVRLRVRLDSSNGRSGVTTATDSDGAFIFNNVDFGNITVEVDGGGTFENAIERFTILREEGPRPRMLTFHMRPKLALNPAFASVPHEAMELFKKALEAGQKGDSKKAIEHLNKALAIHANFGPAMTELGIHYLKMGDAAKSAEALASAAKLAPEDYQTRLNYGIALLQLKKFAEAEEHLAFAVKQNPEAPTPHMYLGIALMSQQKLDDAEKELRLSVASGSVEVAPAHKYLGGIYWGKRDYQRAVEELELYLKLMPKASDAERTKQAIKELRTKL